MKIFRILTQWILKAPILQNYDATYDRIILHGLFMDKEHFTVVGVQGGACFAYSSSCS